MDVAKVAMDSRRMMVEAPLNEGLESSGYM